MKNFLYKLIFPECGKLYFGKAASKYRYTGNRPNDVFHGPHHNAEVQQLLDGGQFCFFSVIKQFQTLEELTIAEDSWLKKVWPDDGFTSRPKFLLNRNRNAIGFASGDLNPVYLISLVDQRDRAKKMREHPATIAGIKAMWDKHKKDPNFIHPCLGKSRPDLTKQNKSEVSRTRSRDHARRINSLRVSCPYCEIVTNPGNLAKHIQRKH